MSHESSYRHKKTPLCYTCCSPQTQERHRDAKSLYYKRQTFTIDSRRLIERWKKEGKSNREIASLLGKAPQTIHTEIKRGTVLQYVGKGRFKEAYSADYAQQSYESAGIKKSSHITQGNRYIKQALTISGLIAAHSNTLQKSLQTTSASSCRTQVQPAARFLVCSLIFIEYKNHFSTKQTYQIEKALGLRKQF